MSKCKYESHIQPRLGEIKHWVRNGISEKDIAGKLDVSYSKFREHKATHNELAAVLVFKRDVVDGMVEEALLKTALGYTTEEKIYEYGIDRKTKQKTEVLVERKVKDVSGNFSAQKFWLEKRRKEQWGPTPEGEETIGGPVKIVE